MAGKAPANSKAASQARQERNRVNWGMGVTPIATSWIRLSHFRPEVFRTEASRKTSGAFRCRKSRTLRPGSGARRQGSHPRSVKVRAQLPAEMPLKCTTSDAEPARDTVNSQEVVEPLVPRARAVIVKVEPAWVNGLAETPCSKVAPSVQLLTCLH